MYNQRHHKEEKNAQDLWTEIEYIEFCLLLFVCPTDVKVTFQILKYFKIVQMDLTELLACL